MHISHLYLEPKIDQKKGALSCNATIYVESAEEQLYFYLNSKLKINKMFFEHDGKKINLDYTIQAPSEDFFINKSVKIIVGIDSKYIKKTDFKVFLEYAGKLEYDDWGTNYITEEAIELALYVAWFPIMELESRPTFEVKIHSPADFEWIVNGVERKNNEKNIFEFYNNTGSNDVVIIGMDSSKIIKDSTDIFWGWCENYKNYKTIEEDLQKVKILMKKWYGEPHNDQLKIVLVPRKQGGAYVRGSLIVTQSDMDEVYFNEKKEWLIHGWAHEIAHKWFCYASVATFDNWLDEAMAEFSSLLVCKELYGEEHLESYLEIVKERMKKEDDLPAIKDIKRSHPKATMVFYYWGTLVLMDIHSKIGDTKFKQVLKDFSQKSIEMESVVTTDFTASLNKITGEDWSTLINKKISEKPHYYVI